MNTPLAIFLSGVVITLFGWLLVPRVANTLTVRRERANRAQAFRGVITSVRDNFDSTPDDKLIEVHRTSIPRVREECAKVRDDLHIAVQQRFDAAVATYCSLDRNGIESRDWSKKVPLATPPADYAAGRLRLRKPLDELIEHAKSTADS